MNSKFCKSLIYSFEQRIFPQWWFNGLFSSKGIILKGIEWIKDTRIYLWCLLRKQTSAKTTEKLGNIECVKS